MSFESVLLLLFLVFPLLERLIRFLRARAGQASAEPVPATQERPAPVRRPTAPEVLAEPAQMPGEAMRPIPVPPPVPPPVPLPPRHPAAERLRAADRVRAGRTSPASEAALPRVRRASTRRDLLLRGGTADLRRAVMLMTILGPCKALESGPERG
jgi:hypothetical protein